MIHPSSELPACRGRNVLLLIVSIGGWVIGCSVAETPPKTMERSGANERVSNLMRATDSICSGGTPDSDVAFAALVRIGVRTIVSVDGVRPGIGAARRHGLRYVHIPIGYDGIGTKAGRSPARVVRDTDGLWFFHCHHGLHREPMAVAAIAGAQANQEGAVEILVRAGTSERYAGLWRYS